MTSPHKQGGQEAENMTDYGFMQSLAGCELRHKENGELHIIPPEGGKIGCNISALIVTACAERDTLLRQRDELANAAIQALSDLEWIEKQVPGSNFQSSIILLRVTLQSLEASHE